MSALPLSIGEILSGHKEGREVNGGHGSVGSRVT